MILQSEAEGRLSELSHAADTAFDGARAAVYLGALDNPHIDLDHYLAHLSELACAAAGRSGQTPAEALADVMSLLYGYRGDRQSYDDMKNADLIHVIDRKRGLPVALGLLYMAAAEGLQCKLTGLSFPGHFLMRIEDGKDRAIIDPFNDGRICQPGALRNLLKRVAGPDAELEPSFFEPITQRAVVVRLLMNIRIRALKAGQVDRAIEVVRRMTLVSPDDARIWADLAELHSSCGNLTAAKAAFERSIESAPNALFKTTVEAELQSVRHRLN